MLNTTVKHISPLKPCYTNQFQSMISFQLVNHLPNNTLQMAE